MRVGVCVRSRFWGRPNEIATVCCLCIFAFFFTLLSISMLLFIIALPNPYMAPVHKVNNWSNMLTALELKMQRKCRQSFSLPWFLLLFIVVSCRVGVFFSSLFVAYLISVVCTCMCISQSELSILSLSRWNRSGKKRNEKKTKSNNSQSLADSFFARCNTQSKALLMHQLVLCIYIFGYGSRAQCAIRQHKTRQSKWTCNSGSYALIQHHNAMAMATAEDEDDGDEGTEKTSNRESYICTST